MKCANHPLNDAFAYCGQCGRSLCNDCKREVSGMVYCESCLATRLHTPLPPLVGSSTGPSPGVALGLGFIPGVGAIYNGQVIKAMVQVLIFGSLIALGDRVHSPLDTIFGLGAAAFYFYMVIDSYHTAKAKQLGKPVPEWFGLGDTKMNVPIGAALLIGLARCSCSTISAYRFSARLASSGPCCSSCWASCCCSAGSVGTNPRHRRAQQIRRNLRKGRAIFPARGGCSL